MVLADRSGNIIWVEMEISIEKYNELKLKADQWDDLYEKIAAFYPEEETDEGEGGDLTDIGEVAAIAFGFL